MKISSEKYVPILKWRQGEYQALFTLKAEVKDKVVPLLVIPPREYDFEEEKMKKTVHEHIETLPKGSIPNGAIGLRSSTSMIPLKLN